MVCNQNSCSQLFYCETGECKGRFTNKKIPYCVKFNPDEDKQNLFVAGLADKKIVTVNCSRNFSLNVSKLWQKV